MFLTSDEIAQLTQRTQRRAQSTVLNFMGLVHKLRPDGSIVLLRAHVEAELGGVGKPKKKAVEPNWSAI